MRCFKTNGASFHELLHCARGLKIFLGRDGRGIPVIIFRCGPSLHDIVMHAIYHGVEATTQDLHPGYGYL